MKKYLILALIIGYFASPFGTATVQGKSILLDEEVQRQCKMLCPMQWGSDEYIQCFKNSCAQLLDQEGEKNTSADEEWKQISIVRSKTKCIAEEGGNEQFYIMVAQTPSRNYGNNEAEAGILNAGDKFEIPEGNEWSVWLKGTKGTLVNLTGGTVMKIPCKEPQGILEAAWEMIGGAGYFNFENPAFVDTRTAIAGVKGTRFAITAEENKTDLYVLEGIVSLTPKNGTGITLEANQWASADERVATDVQQFSALPAHLAKLGKNPPTDSDNANATKNSQNTPNKSSRSFKPTLLVIIALGSALYWYRSRNSSAA